MIRKVIRYLAIGFLGYVALSVLIILPALNIITPRVVHETLGRELRSEIILFNPFTLAVEIRHATLLEPDGEVFLSVDGALVNLSLESIWNRGVVFDAVAVDSLYVHLRLLADGSFNFSDMLGEPSAQKEQSDGELPGLTIHRLSLSSDQIKFTDEGRDQPFSTHWDGLAVSVQTLSTVLEEGRPYRIDAVAESGGKLRWEGVVSLPGTYSEGTLALENISLHPIWRFAQDWLAFELVDGSLSFSGDYRVDWGSDLAYRIHNGGISIDGIDIQPRDIASLPETAIKLSAVELNGIEIDGRRESVDITAVKINGVDVQGFSEGSEVSLTALFETNFPESGEKSDGVAKDGESNWTVYAPSVHLYESRLRWRSEYTSPPVLEISPLDLQLTELHWPPQGNSGVSLSLTVNDITAVAINGDVSLETGSGKLHYQMDKIQLAMGNPNIPAAFKAEITSGELSGEGTLTLTEFAPTRVTMDGSSNSFSGTIEGAEDAILGWDSIRWQELDVSLAQRTVELKTLSLNGYSGRLHIYPDGTINAQRVMRQEIENAVEEGALDEDAGSEWAFNIPAIYFTDSQLYFRDESLPISFGTVIGELEGSITGLSSRPEGETIIDLKGSVDGYAPVVLAGTLSPFSATSAVDVGLSIDGIDLIRLTPYSGTYAGYAIDRGILNLDLHYSLADNRLKGDNSIVIEQPKLGEKIDSDKAVDLPLELALALLTDMNGVIDMNVPVSGDMDDPAFGLSSVIFSALVNIISKAITAPFALLANLVGSEEDMQRIPFSSGSSELNEAAISRLTQLSEALVQRPGLSLVLLGRLHPSADRERLQKNILEQELVATGLSILDVTSKGEQWAKAIQARYKQLGNTGGATQGGPEMPVHEQYQQLVAGIAVSDKQLQVLAEERAVSVKRYLVNELQFPADRSAIELVAVDDEKNVFSGVELGVDI
ncbi:MAG: DUF748 domain-containing protein [Proteobacteria bacterium]|nr:DUF748 domain-containing protein [Pseudomonadota bacterium]